MRIRVPVAVAWVLRSVIGRDRKSTRLNSSHTEIYTLSLHDALPISSDAGGEAFADDGMIIDDEDSGACCGGMGLEVSHRERSEEHTSELQSHRDLHSFPTRRSSDLERCGRRGLRGRWDDHRR